MDIKQLRSFVHIAELGSLSRAAERLNLSQPALSRQLNLLEESLDTKLLERTGRGVKLTEAGQMLAERARVILTDLARLEADLSARSSQVTGHVHVGVPPSAGIVITGALIENLRDRYPDLNVTVAEDLTGDVQEGLLSGRIDIGILHDGMISRSLYAEPLWREDLFLISHPSQVGEQETEIAYEDVLSLPLIMPTNKHGLRAMMQEAAFRAGRPLTPVVEADALRVLIDLVTRNLGHTVLPRSSLVQELSTGRLTARRITNPQLSRKVMLSWLQERPLSAGGKAVVDTLRDLAGTVPMANQ
ncbi:MULTISPECIES: LysR family transcriptional regulator [Thalassospira]|uniref:LysR family transcriptional regulator n=1 Tax=Thalassospira profundimaris TaxID=502049 RepID=A0A367VKC5_9PROT|nr:MULTISPECIES: LysR family transcriptional regulator [Thalassospira]KZB70715.1 LysR family transcriptional regulator [Thalassospira sp. MCCC 1A01148]MBR9899597.1 LysR family transcriptional regulator [Rhodospirillales bacterium]RCK25654.1 LysR family transcriptional regulator [Thalassospira profundimaris]